MTDGLNRYEVSMMLNLYRKKQGVRVQVGSQTYQALIARGFIHEVGYHQRASGNVRVKMTDLGKEWVEDYLYAEDDPVRIAVLRGDVEAVKRMIEEARKTSIIK